MIFENFYFTNLSLHTSFELPKVEEGNLTQTIYNISMEKILTLHNGFCYKITLGTSMGFHYYNINYTDSLTSEDIAIPQIYITSEENANGILNVKWFNGEETIFPIDEWLYVFKMKGLKRKFLKETSGCTNDLSNRCIVETIMDENINPMGNHR